MRDHHTLRRSFFLLLIAAVLFSSGCTHLSVLRQTAKARVAQESADDAAWEFAKQTLAEQDNDITDLSFFPLEQDSVLSNGKDTFSVRGHALGLRKQDRSPVTVRWTLGLKRLSDNRWESMSRSTSSSSRPETPSTTYVGVVPLDKESEGPVREMAAYFDRKFSLKMKQLPTLDVPPGGVDTNRNQTATETLVKWMQRRYRNSVPEGALLIGVTGQDIYSRDEPHLRFVFSSRFVTEQGRYAVISTARLDPANLGQGPDPSLLQSRLRKMALKNIGILQYGMSPSSNPRSFLFTPIMELRDIDTMGDGF